MATILAILGLLGGLAVAILGSRRAVVWAVRAADASGISSGLIGATVVAIGTDLPELANSVVAAIGSHGDLVVGDAAGSALTQVTLVLAVLCFVTTLESDRGPLLALGAMTVASLLAAAWFVRDDELSRVDALVLCAAWVAGLAVVRGVDRPSEAPPPRLPGAGAWVALGRSLAWLAVVAGGATASVEGFVHLADRVGVPELLASAVVLSLGTSLPELVVDVTAVRRGATLLALGDLFGSSFLDVTLALGLGPAIEPATVSGEAAALCVVTAIGIAAATLIVVARRRHSRRSGIELLTVYAVTMLAVVAVAR